MSEYNRCEECNMKFNTPQQLHKHKEKFCIGGTGLGDPNVLAPAGPVHIPRVHLSGRSDRESPLHGQKSDRSGRQPRYGGGRRRVSSRNSDSTMSLHFSSDDDYRQPVYSDDRRHQQLRIAEEHGRQVADIHNRQHDLEKQKEDIRRRLKELTSQDYGNSVALATSNLVKDLKEREEQNQDQIQQLKDKMNNMQLAPVQNACPTCSPDSMDLAISSYISNKELRQKLSRESVEEVFLI